MKHNLLSLLLATTILSGGAVIDQANAQDPVMPTEPQIGAHFDREQMHKEISQKIAQDLSLTKEQQEQAKAIHEKGKKDIEPLLNEMKDLRQKMDEKRRANMEEFEQILTPEQKAKFEEMKKNAPKPHGRHFKDHGPRHPNFEQK